jgi:cytosine/uracil/thiamine/allantoin permease
MSAIGVIAAPLAGVVLADLTLRRFVLDVQSLLEDGRRYWYQHGVNVIALLAIAAGSLVYLAIPETFIKAVWGVAGAALVYVAAFTPAFGRQLVNPRHLS